VTIPSKLDPTADVVFQILFGSEGNKDLLISLLNSIVGPEIDVIDVIIKNPFNLASYRRGKRSILDIKVVDQNGIWYDIEMQCTEHVVYGKRAIFYVSKVYADQLEAGTSYSGLNTTIGVHFLDFNYFDDDRMVQHFVFKEMETNEHPEQLSFLQLYFVELSKFRKDWSQISTALDRWVAFLTKAKLLERSALPVS
jgi:predicted transposase/invertase (TIGR01784 family)